MLIAQDLICFASDADCTGLNLGLPRMLIAQDLICFASDADCTGLNLDSPRMLIAQDLTWFVYSPRLTLDYQFGYVLTLSCTLTCLDLHH